MAKSSGTPIWWLCAALFGEKQVFPKGGVRVGHYMHDSFSTTWIRVDTGPICRPFVLAQEKGFGSGLAAVWVCQSQFTGPDFEMK